MDVGNDVGDNYDDDGHDGSDCRTVDDDDDDDDEDDDGDDNGSYDDDDEEDGDMKDERTLLEDSHDMCNMRQARKTDGNSLFLCCTCVFVSFLCRLDEFFTVYY